MERHTLWKNCICLLLFLSISFCLLILVIKSDSQDYWIISELDLARRAEAHVGNSTLRFGPDAFKMIKVKNIQFQKFISWKKLYWNKSSNRYVIGLPIVLRKTENYYEETVEGLFLSLSHSNISYQIIIQIGERNLTRIEPIITTIYKLIKKYNHPDKVEIIIPNPTLYNVLGQNSSEKKYWKMKLHLDFAHLLLYSSTKGGFYLHLEDDIVVTDRYLDLVENFVQKVDVQHWKMLEFSTLGLLGKLFKVQDVPKLVRYLVDEYYQDFSIEDIISTFVESSCFNEVTCVSDVAQLRLLHRPSLFEHIGFYSSYPGAEWTNNSDVNVPIGYEPWPWNDVPIYVNPPARISTSLKLQNSHALKKLYSMVDVLLAHPANIGDVIYFNFTPPIVIEEFFVRTAHPSYPKKGLNTNTYVEVLPLHPEKVKLKLNGLFKFSKTPSGYIKVGRINDRGIAEGPIGDDFGKLRSLRISVSSSQTYDVLIKELILKLQLVSSCK